MGCDVSLAAGPRQSLTGAQRAKPLGSSTNLFWELKRMGGGKLGQGVGALKREGGWNPLTNYE